MTADDIDLTAGEDEVVQGLRGALRSIAEREPVRLDVAEWIEGVPRQRRFSRRLPVGIAAALVVVLVGALALGARPPSVAGPGYSHFDNGQFSFDYPSAWHSLSTDPGSIVLGTGKWCGGAPSSGCGEDNLDISGGAIVVRVWETAGAAPAYCSAAGASGSASRGTVRKFTEDSLHASEPTTRWEVRRPGYDFGMDGNVWIEAMTSNHAELASAQALVDGFHWDRDYCSSPTAASTLPGTAGRFDNGRFSFDYPENWQAISGRFSEGMAFEVFGVMGTGSWHSGCRVEDNGGACTGDAVDVSGGRVVVKVFERVGGPAPTCENDVQANATLGPNAIRKTTDKGSTTWEIRFPGYEFGWPNDVFVQAWTDSPAAMVQVDSLVASFRWASGVSAGRDACASAAPSTPTPTPAPAISHYDADGISFDFPASWRLISGYQHWGLHGPTIEFAVGTGSVDSGCTEVKPTGDIGGGVTCGASPKASVGTGQVVVYWYVGAHMLGPGPLPSGTLAPGAQLARVNGLPAIETRGDGWARWQISAIGYLAARWGPDATDADAQVDALIASLRFNAADFGI